MSYIQVYAFLQNISVIPLITFLTALSLSLYLFFRDKYIYVEIKHAGTQMINEFLNYKSIIIKLPKQSTIEELKKEVRKRVKYSNHHKLLCSPLGYEYKETVKLEDIHNNFYQDKLILFIVIPGY